MASFPPSAFSMAPRNTLTQHQKIHIRRQFSGHSATCMRSLAERLGVSKTTLGSILDKGSHLQGQGSVVAATSPPHITFDFFQTSLANLQEKEEAVSSENEGVGSLKVKEEDADPEKEEVDGLEVKDEPVSLARNEGGRLKRNEEDNKAWEEESVLAERLTQVCLNDPSPPYFSVGKSDLEAIESRNLSLRELTTAMITLRQVVESYSDMPRWFTFIFDHMFQFNPLEGDADPGVWSEERGTASLPPRQDIVSALHVLWDVLRSGHDLPAWCAFTLSRVQQRYRLRRRSHPSIGVKTKISRRSLSTSFYSWTCY